MYCLALRLVLGIGAGPTTMLQGRAELTDGVLEAGSVYW